LWKQTHLPQNNQNPSKASNNAIPAHTRAFLLLNAISNAQTHHKLSSGIGFVPFFHISCFLFSISSTNFSGSLYSVFELHHHPPPPLPDVVLWPTDDDVLISSFLALLSSTSFASAAIFLSRSILSAAAAASQTAINQYILIPIQIRNAER
jgi:hypothetical protein